jgi:diacylglycerol kinase
MDMNEKEEGFSIKRRAESFVHAGRGVWLFLKTARNSWLQIAALAVAVLLGFHFDITRTEWMMLVLAAGLVIAAEAFNTAIEIDIDLTSPGFHPDARDTKDVAAGAVLISAATAFVVGVLIFGHYIF